MNNFPESIKNKYYDMIENSITETPYGVITKELQKSILTWNNDSLKYLTLVKKGIDYAGYNDIESGEYGIASYDSDYSKIVSTDPMDPEIVSFDYKGEIEIIDGDPIQQITDVEFQPTDGLTENSYSYTVPQNDVPMYVLVDADDSGTPVSDYAEYMLPEEIMVTNKFIPRLINNDEMNYINVFNEEYQRKLIAMLLWNLVSFNENQEFSEIEFGENHNFRNYGYKLFRENNGSLFNSIFSQLSNQIGAKRAYINLDNGMYLNFYIRENQTTGKPELHLNVNYRQQDLFQAMYDNFFWSWLHRQVYHGMVEVYIGLVSATVSIIADFHSYKVNNETTEFWKLHDLQVIDFDGENEIEDELIISDYQVSNSIPQFINRDAMKYVYRIMKNDEYDYNSFENYLNLIVKKI